MKKYIIIGIGIVVVVVLAFIIPPPNGFFGAVDDTTIAKLQEKYSVAPKEIKNKYVLENTALKATPKDDPKDRVEIWIGEKPTDKLGATITNFEPKLTIARWDSEVEFSIKPIAFDLVALKDRTLKFDKEKTIFSTPKIDYSLYEMPISEANPEGAYEFEVILKEKPATNKIEFTLNTKGLDFFYQPELTQEEIDEDAIRPENVVGSYAVYVSENKTNYVGGKEYKCGKVGQIYRPKIIDSVGTEVWGELFIENGILSVTIPQDFLDKAVYPVIVDPTFGWTVQGLSNTAIGTDRFKGWQATPADGNGNVTNIDAWIKYNAASVATKAYVLLGADGSYLGKSDAWTITAGYDAQKSWSFTTQPSVTNGTSYALGINTNGAYNLYYDASADPPGNEDDTFTYDTTGGATLIEYNRRWSIYATYTAAAAAAVEDPPVIIIVD